jgi:hypothetical protein
MQESNIKTALESAKNIGILTKNNANDDTIGAALALFFALRSSGKNVYFPTEDVSPKIQGFIRNRSSKKFKISFEGEVSEVYYEKKDKGIALYLTPKDKDASDDKFSYKVISGESPLSSNSNYDILFTLGIEEFGDVENLCKETADQLYSCTIINIDNNLNNQNYGEINMIKDNQSISQSVACILKEIGQYQNEEADSFLLYGLSFSNKKSDNEKKVSTIRWLLKNGGKLNLFSRNSFKNNLLEIVLKNLVFENNVYISTIPEQSFTKNNATSKDLSFVVDKLKNFLNLPTFFILWESRTSPLSVKGLFYSNKKHIQEKINSNFKGAYKEKGGIFLTEENELDIAKEKLLSFLN